MSEVVAVLDRSKTCFQHIQQWFPLWQELAEVLHPVRASFTMPVDVGREPQRGIYDATPMIARRGLATAIDGLLKPSTVRWFWMKAIDEGLNENDEAKTWFEDTGDRMWNAIYATEARWIASSGGVDHDLATFGLGHLWIGENKNRTGLNFKSLFIGDVAYEENADGVIDTYYIRRRYTARQVKQRFPNNVTKKVQEALEDDKKQTHLFEYIQEISPNGEYDPRRADEYGKRYASKIVAVEDEAIVERGGFHELPISTPRWELAPGQTVPRSPGMMALPDSRTLQAMGHTLLVGGQRAVDPPIWIADDGVLSAARTYPGGLTVVSADIVRETNGHPMGQLDTGTNLPIGRDMQEDYRSQVEAAFFRNVFNLPVDGKQMTATEVRERKEEFLRHIGPTMGQLETDYIGKTINRVFGVMMRLGAFSAPPEVLQEQDVEFEFMSPVQQARKQIDAAGLGQMLEFLGPLAEADPEVLDNLDGDEIVRDLPEIFSTKQKWLRPLEEVEARRQQRMEQQAMMMAAQAAKPVADAVKAGAQAEQIANELPA